jgi:hypothetical protein
MSRVDHEAANIPLLVYGLLASIFLFGAPILLFVPALGPGWMLASFAVAATCMFRAVFVAFSGKPKW